MAKYDAKLVTTYQDMLKWADLYARPDGIGFLIVIGGAGVGKSSIFRNRLPKKTTAWFEGSLSAFHFYRSLYKSIHLPVVIDDVDALFSDKASVNLLKCVCQTDDRKTVAWGKASKILDNEGIPTSFVTCSRVCILGNKMPGGDANLQAVLSRATILNFYPTVEEVHRAVKDWIEDSEIYDFFAQHLRLIAARDMRPYWHAKEQKRLGEDWRRWLLDQWKNKPKIALVAAIMDDKSLATSEERVERFAELGGGTRNTWFIYLRKWKETQGIKGRGRRAVASESDEEVLMADT